MCDGDGSDVENDRSVSNSGRSTPVRAHRARKERAHGDGAHGARRNPLANETTNAATTSRVAREDESSASLARLLQEQERAYFMMQFGERGADAVVEDALVEDALVEDERVVEEMEEDESLALARQLQEEEERAYRQRMLAMAGIDPDAEEDSEAEGIDTDAMTYEELCELGDTVGKVSCGLTEEQLASLPARIVDAKVAGTKCAVCCMEFDLGESACQLPRCGHVYHGECVEPWLKENKSCPTCKTEVFEDKTEKKTVRRAL
ncbi:Zinc finger, RING/FYVE/PHD-type [Ostreococcus tauri]|uniref:Zinc finger, RING/FYVE/PHD-type n=1 Tax=Ostreococcus tauri TaxID=70448 RepID=A0A090MBH3_OSTTA|nr:Zinc finger, RING/FYVE/PHD-type [Ostreococcus tauri]CEF99414.1 Zinc finger, RING/FYVE/PHD-type [Ostreococcus tauri]|eukprot:XP_003081678.2 Zinc finger, RING/FYVE/PHD-type [Ostreococcus tauri]